MAPVRLLQLSLLFALGALLPALLQVAAHALDVEWARQLSELAGHGLVRAIDGTPSWAVLGAYAAAVALALALGMSGATGVAGAGSALFPFRTKQGAPPGGAAAAGAAARAALESADPEEEGVHAPFQFERIPVADMQLRARTFAEFMDQRRSVRFFSREPVPLDVVQNCVRTGASAPSGAHTQPWVFVVVGRAEVKAAIRAAVEAEEKVNYERRMRKAWVEDVTPLVSGLPNAWVKPYLEDAPFIVVVMKLTKRVHADGKEEPVYYPAESCGIACGMFITALHNANLATLTSTPMGAESKIRKILGRPDHERVFLLMPVGFPAANATVPYRDGGTLRRPLSETMPVLS